MVIDALDECERDEDVRTLLCLLPQVQQSSSVQIRFLLTGRPELQIEQGFQQVPHDFQNVILYEIAAPIIRRDISFYFEHQFSKLREEEEQILPADWPDDKALNILVERTIPLFISAATICRFLRDKN